MPKKILFINQEITPYLPESEMASLGQRLPEKIQGVGYEIRTFMPKWGTINERRGQLHEVIRLSGLNIPVGGNDHPLLIKVASIPVSRVQVYFIDNDEFFSKRKMLTNAEGEEYADNGERAVFFARGVLETVKKLRWKPDVIVCQGWMGAVVPLYIKTLYAEEPCFAESKVISSFFTGKIKDFEPNFKHFLEYQETTAEVLAPYKDNFDFLELAKLGIDFSDAFICASEGLDSRICDYAKTKDIPFIDYRGDGYIDAVKQTIEELTKE